MTSSEKKEQEKVILKDKNKTQENGQEEKKTTPIKEETPEEKLKIVQEKLLRTMAEWKIKEEGLKKKNKKHLNLVVLTLLQNLYLL